MAIRYRESDLDKLNRTVENFNRKIRRAAARGVVGLPEPVRVRDLKEEIVSRSDFNRELNALQRFSRKGAERTVILHQETGVAITKWERDELSRLQAIVETRKRRVREEMGSQPATRLGEPLGMTRGEMHSARMNALAESKLNYKAFRSPSEIRARKRTLGTRARSDYFKRADEKYRDNYVKGLETVFGKKAAPLIAHIRSMDPHDVVRKYYKDQEGTIRFLYEKAQRESHLKAIMQMWTRQDLADAMDEETDEELDED